MKRFQISGTKGGTPRSLLDLEISCSDSLLISSARLWPSRQAPIAPRSAEQPSVKGREQK
jgi:hypothetical protein